MAQGIGNFIDRVQLGNDEAHQIAIGSSAYGVCSSLGTTTEKAVSLPGFTLNPGTTIHIKFNHANLATSPTLNVNNTGAKPIVQYNTEAIDSWFDGAVLTLTYDGTSWVRDQDTNTTYTISPSLTNGKIRIISSAGEDYDIGVTGLAALAYKSELLESDIPDLSWTKITTGVPTTLSGYGITDAFIDNNGTITLGSETITPIVSVNGYTGSEITISPSDLGLSNALHFIGIVDSNSIYTPIDGDINTENNPKIPTIANWPPSSPSYSPQAGDIVLDKNENREYVYTSTNTWELLGQDASTAYSISLDAYERITQISQATDRTITVTKQTISTLPIIYGGTGVNSFTSNQVILSDNINGVTNLVSRAYSNSDRAEALDSTSENFVTERDIYYGLPIINGNHTYTSETSIYAPSSAGSLGQILTSSGGIPVWAKYIIAESVFSNTATTAAYSTLILGNNVNQSANTEHSEGQIKLYSAATHAHILQGASTTDDYTHILPNNDGVLVQTALGGTVGGPTQPIYINDNVVTAITYTPNRLYYSASTTSFEATNHYATSTSLALNDANTVYTESAPRPTSYTFYVNGDSYFNGNTTHNGTDYFANGTTYYIDNNGDAHLRNLGIGTATINNSYALNIGGNVYLNGTHYFANGTTYYIDNSATGYLSDFSVDNTRLNDSYLGFYSQVNAGGNRLGYIQGVIDNMHFRIENGTENVVPQFDFNGHILPSANNIGCLGASDKRWTKLYVGTAASYGDAYTPIYWNDGVPTAVTPVQYCEFTISSGKTGVRLSHTAFTNKSYVLQIVITSGESNLNSAISWTSNTGYIDLTCSATSGAISGYILVSRGDSLTSVTQADLPIT